MSPLVQEGLSLADMVMMAAAKAALKAAVAGDVPGAAMLLKGAIDVIPGGRVNWFVPMITWADITFTTRFGPGWRGGPVALTFTSPDGTVHDADGVSAAQAWVGRLFAARLAGDAATVRALVESADPAMIPSYVSQALLVAASACQGKGIFRAGWRPG